MKGVTRRQRRVVFHRECFSERGVNRFDHEASWGGHHF